MEQRLQKIIADAGITSRRKAEQIILEGRVSVNGKSVSKLGSKADLEHDHIRVDGKLLQGSERLRYFMLNKPKGFVTTVSDPEHRPTVMEFFTKIKERVYPVGRLDHDSEGLLLLGYFLRNLEVAAGERPWLDWAGPPSSRRPSNRRHDLTRGDQWRRRPHHGSANSQPPPSCRRRYSGRSSLRASGRSSSHGSNQCSVTDLARIGARSPAKSATLGQR